jgi:hypothetical protein
LAAAIAIVVTGLAAPGGASGGLQSTPAAANCQPFKSQPCLLPFPNDLFTKHDASSPTGRRVHLPQAAMPTNTEGQQIDVAEYNRNDGFSPGSAIVVRVPGLDNPGAFNKTNPVRLTDMSKAFKNGAPIVVIDAKTGKRQLIWAELDANASDPQHTTVLIHPGKNFTEGHRYIVALRDLKNKSGQTLHAPSWFEKLRDGKSLPDAEKSQKARYSSIFKSLKKAGIARHSLYEAWDFTVESRQGLSTRLLSIRNDAFNQLGDTDLGDGQVQGNAPAFHVDNVQADPAPGIAKYVTGTFTAPCYLTTDNCDIGGGFNYSSKNPDAVPSQKPGNLATANFYCIVPTSATGMNPARPSLYGHGLLGSGSEVTAGPVEALASEHNFVVCATDWWGLSESDVPYDISALQDLNKFPSVVDRLQQGVLNTLFLGRLLTNSDGLASDPAFQQTGTPLFDTSHAYYDGNSQGGIMGGITTAVSPDFTRAVLGVPGMDYGGLLLQRSTDFSSYALFLYGQAPGGGYTDDSLHPLILDLMQQLWDRGEADGYAAHMTSSPYPDTPAHQVLMHVAYGDFQVSQYSAAVEARTIGAKVHEPALDAVRAQDQRLFYRVPAIPSYPFDGSAIVIWDSGPGHTQPPPVTNTAPVESDSPPVNQDPHQNPRNTVAARNQISAFLMPSGVVTDVCAGLPCHSDAYTP